MFHVISIFVTGLPVTIFIKYGTFKKYTEYPGGKEITETQTRTLTLITHTGLPATKSYCLNQLKSVHSEKDKAQVMT